MTKKKQVIAWIVMAASVVGFFFFSIEMAEIMR